MTLQDRRVRRGAQRTASKLTPQNSRVVVPIQSPEFGQVVLVCVGAMMVGTTQITVTEGQSVERGQEIGFFKFGGSTVLLLVPPKPGLTFDEDILANSRQQIETLVRVSMQIGTRTD